MKKLLTFCLIFLYSYSQAQTDRSFLDPALAPFYHGIASGDPLPDRVMIWTRITLDPPVTPVTVSWRMATDTLFTNIVASGTAQTDVIRDYTIKVDVTGLQPNSWYYYQFEYNGIKSITGRTHTMPIGDVDSIRLAVVSCSDYQNGYFNAYRDIALRNDVDYLLHLGDYIYEYAASSSLADRNHEPTNEIITISDYRIRHSLYKLDADLRLIHQQLPMISVWDDHETANNSWMNGAENHTPSTEGDWQIRKKSGIQAYLEWMPLRQPDINDSLKIYRHFNFGNLLDLYMLDTRLEGRDEQVSGSSSAINDPNRRIISETQFNWLVNNMKQSAAKWQVLGQQVMVAPLKILGTPVNTDQWDGYPVQRQQLYDSVLINNVQNMVVLTGDIHTSWANDLPLSGYVGSTGANSAGVEFVTTSITSSNSPFGLSSSIIAALFSHVKYANLTNHGYYILDLNKTRTQADFYNVSDINSKNYTITVDASWYTLDGTRHLQQASSVAVGGIYPPLAPYNSGNISLDPNANVITLGAFPNPFYHQIVIQYYTYQPEKMDIIITNLEGKIILHQPLGLSQSGLNHTHFDGSQLAAGMYIITLQGEKSKASKRLLKVD
ncbi:MAG: alkaline phosphatase D family protein [Candidatus Competibacteraceae bacterium]|nr:alkaline phosphatase D family protein [Candidatus Competibacteraceae bacterium]